ncbi:MAG: hypothetical protein ACO1SX_18315 [Actinomycetota bacterium]
MILAAGNTSMTHSLTPIEPRELKLRRSFQKHLLQLLKTAPPECGPLTLDAILDCAFPACYGCTVGKSQLPQVEEWVDELRQKGFILRSGGTTPVFQLRDPEAKVDDLVTQLGSSPDLSNGDQVLIAICLTLSVMLFVALHLFFLPNNLLAQTLSATTLGWGLLGGIFVPTVRAAFVPAYAKPPWLIPVAVLIPLILGSALLIGVLNPVRIRVVPEAEILVDGKHYRNVPRDFKDKEFQAHLTWEPHEIAIRRPYFVEPRERSKLASGRVEWEPWGRSVNPELRANLHLDSKEYVLPDKSDDEQKATAAAANGDLHRLMARLSRLQALSEEIQASSPDAASLRMQVAALRTPLGRMTLSVRFQVDDRQVQEIAYHEVTKTGLSAEVQDKLFKTSARDLYQKLGVGTAEQADMDCKQIIEQERAQASDPKNLKRNPERDPTIAAAPPLPPDSVKGPLAEKLASIAEHQVGVRENPLGSNRGPKIDDYLRAGGMSEPEVLAGQPWGTAFTSWCIQQAYRQANQTSPVPRTVYGPELFAWATRNRKVIRNSERVKRGDLCFLANGKYTRQAGIVAEVFDDGKQVITIEGNLPDPDGVEGVTVRRNKRRVDACRFVRL